MIPVFVTDKHAPQTSPCYFCYTGSSGVAEAFKSWDDGLARFVADILREGPEAKPTHQICRSCYEAGKHRQRSRCQNCGKLASLLRTANDSMTNTWADIGPDHVILCEVCQKVYYDTDKRQWTFKYDGGGKLIIPYTSKVPLTDEDILLLRRLWREYPDWKTRNKMPTLHRRIDDD
jgi:ribosomal protein L37E